MNLRQKVNRIIFGTETPAGKLFDLLLIVTILFSILVVLIESIPEVRQSRGVMLNRIEWSLTILFTVEYLLRIIVCDRRRNYFFSFFGVIDLLAILPSYLAFFWGSANIFAVVRALRLLRIFRILKLFQFIAQAEAISNALREARAKILVFLFTVLNLVTIIGAVIYVIEGEESGFDSIPHSIYWAIVTITTVGYGDLAPTTLWGRVLASAVMLIGFSIIAVPTGLITGKVVKRVKKVGALSECPRCGQRRHIENARYCHNCGERLAAEQL